MIKKILIGILVLLVILAIAGFLGLKYLQSMMDQVRLQYDKEVISDYKRELDYSLYDLNTFDAYDKIHQLVNGQNLERIQSLLVEGEFSTVDLCKYYIKRIKDHEAYNVVVQLNPEILKEAQAIDEKIQAGKVESLFGAVVLVKDNIAAIHMNTAAGAYALKDLTTKRDAFIVKSLKDQDSLILGKANLSEWSNFMSSPSSSGFSVLGGQTKNAYGKFDVGGSSSGSSVAVALNLSTVSLGSETAGSLIFPAGQNSVVALKPTIGLLSRDLIIPISEAQDTAGVIARNVSDLSLVFNALVKEDKHDPATSIVRDYDKQVLFDEAILKGKTLGMVDNGSSEMKTIKEDFESLGAEVKIIKLADQAYQADMMSVLNYGIINDVNSFLNNEAVDSKYKTMKDIIDFYNNNQAYMPFGNQLHVDALKLQGQVDEIIANNQKLTRQALDQVLESCDAIISMSNDLSAVYAPAGYPAITVPSGYRPSGEPYGVTLVASYLEDQKLIAYAYAYEQAYKYRKEVE